MAIWIVLALIAAIACAEAVAILALAREVGLLARRLEPAPALDSLEGVAVGDPLDSFVAELLPGERRRVLGGASTVSPQLMLFLSPTCTTCRTLLAEVDALARDLGDTELVPIISGRRETVLALLKTLNVHSPIYRDNGEAMKLAGIVSTPQALLLGEASVVLARGIVNSRDMAISLLEGRIRTQDPGLVWESTEQIS